MAKIVC